MKRISFRRVSAAQARISGFSPEEQTRSIERLKQEQPILFSYIRHAEDRLGGPIKGSLSILLWLVFEAMDGQRRRPLPEVSEALLLAVHATNDRMTDPEASEIQQDEALRKIVMSHNQLPLLWFAIQALLPDDDSELDCRDADFAIMYIKTAIDCLDQVTSTKHRR